MLGECYFYFSATPVASLNPDRREGEVLEVQI